MNYKNLKKCLKSWHRLGYKPRVKMAPKDAVTFDRMIVVFLSSSDSEDFIFKVLFYNSKTDEVR